MASPSDNEKIVIVQNTPVINVSYLKSLAAEEVISFLHSYTSAKEMVGTNVNMLIKGYIDGTLVRELSEVYQANDEASIIKILEQIVAEYDDMKEADSCLRRIQLN